MVFKLYNTATKKKEEFKPLGETIKMYTCGPTVYNVVHIGNWASFLAADVLKRYLRYKGYSVKQVMNLTDVDDKTIRGAAQERLPLSEFTKKYEDLFFADIERLNFDPPEYVRATDHINEMVEDIEAIKEKGCAYEEDGSTYFSISSFPSYGALANIEARRKGESRHRVDADEYEKDVVDDFVLWKAWKPEDGEVFWETSLGKGRPGWSMECSTMIRRHLGDQIDIHTGGADLIFPHHTNEIAQAECVTEKQFVKFWIHRAFLDIQGEKMSKSLGNILTLDDVASSDLEVLAFRLLIVTSHYRTPLSFNDKSMPSAKATLTRLLDFADGIESSVSDGADVPSQDAAEKVEKARSEFSKVLDDDLNTPKASAVVFDLIKEINPEKINQEDAMVVWRFFVDDVDAVFGVIGEGLPLYRAATKRSLNQEESALLATLEANRAKKDYEAADQARDALSAAGIEVRITPEGVDWHRDPFSGVDSTKES